jgi:hypothetical protein
MSKDEEREAEALAWAEATFMDVVEAMDYMRSDNKVATRIN